MKIEIKRLVRPVFLRDYAEEYGDETIWVWVNPPRQLRLEHADIVQDFQVVVDARAELGAELEKAIEQAKEEGTEVPEADPDTIARIDQQLNDLSDRLYAWFAELWSQHSDEETHWTGEEVVGMVEACLDADPQLWDWIQDEMWRLVREHREGVKKK